MATLKDLTVEGDVRGQGFIDLIYPVGSIYLSVNSANPSTIFGGTWEPFGGGRVLTGVDEDQPEFNEVEKTGGEKTAELRALIGAINNDVGKICYKGTGPVGDAMSEDNKYNMILTGTAGGGLNNINHSTVVRNVNGKDQSLLQPYITCYMWKRTS